MAICFRQRLKEQRCGSRRTEAAIKARRLGLNTGSLTCGQSNRIRPPGQLVKPAEIGLVNYTMCLASASELNMAQLTARRLTHSTLSVALLLAASPVRAETKIQAAAKQIEADAKRENPRMGLDTLISAADRLRSVDPATARHLLD